MKFDDLISTIDLLSDEQIDEVVDWQLAQSPAAHAEHGGARGTGPGVGAVVHNMRTVELVQGWLDTLLSVLSPVDLPALDINLWRPGDELPPSEYLDAIDAVRLAMSDRCAQCQRYMPNSAPDPDLSRPGVLFCDECAVFNP